MSEWKAFAPTDYENYLQAGWHAFVQITLE